MLEHLLSGRTALVTGAGRSVGRGIAEVLGESGAFVVVNELCADRAAETIESIERAGGRATASTWRSGAWSRGSPVGRLGEPREVGAAAAFLASDDAAFITGQIIHINGGARFGR